PRRASTHVHRQDRLPAPDPDGLGATPRRVIARGDRMDLGWTEEQAQLRATIVAFARAELNDGLMEREARGEFHREGWRRCAQMGVHGLPVPVEYGGMGVDALTTMGVLESLGEGCKDNGLVFSINAHMWTLEMPLLGFGTEAQKQRWLPRLCSGELIGGN